MELSPRERSQLQTRTEYAVGIKERAIGNAAASDGEIDDLIVGWCHACRHLEGNLSDEDNELVGRLFHASRNAVIELATILDMDADRLLQDRSGESVLWLQLRSKAARRNRKPLEQSEQWEPKVPENGDVQLLTLWLKDGIGRGVTQSDVCRRFASEWRVDDKKVASLMAQAKRFRHLWDPKHGD
jgi:hypothetical protein